MSNPLMNMMGNAKGRTTMGGSMMGMFGQIRKFAGMIGNRNPEQMARNYMKQNGIPESELQNVMQEAQEIARMMGMR